MLEGEARFEFRVWNDRLDEVTDRLRSLSDPFEVRESTETYFVSAVTVDVNPKARADQLDIKVLIGVREGFEQWGVKLKAEFPLDSALVMTELFLSLRLAPPRLERDAYTLSQLVAEVVPAHPDLAAVEVKKHRQMHTVLACTAEVTDAAIARQELVTVAVESADLSALRDVCRILGLDAYDNVSYPRAIRGVLGGRFRRRLSERRDSSSGP